MARTYLIAHVSVDNPQGYQAYSSRSGAIVERFGGRFLVRGGKLHPLEDQIDFDRFVVVEFPDLDSAQNFYHSPEYQEILPHRTANSRGMLFFAEGMDA